MTIRPSAVVRAALRALSAPTTMAALAAALSPALPPGPALAQQVGAPMTASDLAGITSTPAVPAEEPPDALVEIIERETGTASLDELADPDSDFYRKRGTFSVGGARAQVIQAAARGVGFRGGFAHEAERINKLLMSRYRGRIERTYTFRPLMLQNGYVVPPVITAIEDVVELSGPNFLYLSNGAFEIVRQPRLTTRTPSWMDWLLLPVRDASPPRDIELEGAGEKNLWRRTVLEAWTEGVEDARAAFTVALATLHRDYQGMRLYRALAAMGAVSVPRVDVRSRGWRVTEDGQRAFEGETTLEIVVGPEFQRR